MKDLGTVSPRQWEIIEDTSMWCYMIDFPPAHAFYGEISNSFHPEQDENVLLYISVTN